MFPDITNGDTENRLSIVSPVDKILNCQRVDTSKNLHTTHSVTKKVMCMQLYLRSDRRSSHTKAKLKNEKVIMFDKSSEEDTSAKVVSKIVILCDIQLHLF